MVCPLICTPQLPAVDWTDSPTDLNGLVHFSERPNLVSAHVPSRFKRAIPLCACRSLLTGESDFVLVTFLLLVPILPCEEWENACQAPYRWNTWIQKDGVWYHEGNFLKFIDIAVSVHAMQPAPWYVSTSALEDQSPVCHPYGSYTSLWCRFQDGVLEGFTLVLSALCELLLCIPVDNHKT